MIWAMDDDIKGCFYTINHRVLMEKLLDIEGRLH